MRILKVILLSIILSEGNIPGIILDGIGNAFGLVDKVPDLILGFTAVFIIFPGVFMGVTYLIVLGVRWLRRPQELPTKYAIGLRALHRGTNTLCYIFNNKTPQ